MVYSKMYLPDQNPESVTEFKMFENKLYKFKNQLSKYGLLN